MQERPIITQKMKSLVLTMSCFPHCGNLDTFILCGSFDIFENGENNCKADISLSVNFPEMLYLFFFLTPHSESMWSVLLYDGGKLRGAQLSM